MQASIEVMLAWIFILSVYTTSDELTDQGGPVRGVKEVTLQLYYLAAGNIHLHFHVVKNSLRRRYWEKLDLLVEALKSVRELPVGTALLNTRDLPVGTALLNTRELCYESKSAHSE